MKILTPALLLIAGVAAGRLSAEAVARFTNEDSLPGTLESLTPEVLVWKSPVLDQPAPIFLKKVMDVTLPSEPPVLAADHVAEVALTNGDSVRGQLVSVTDDAVALDTWFAGRMEFRLPMVASLRIEGKSNFLYRGPGGMDDWKQDRSEDPAWSFGRSAFVSQAAGSIARGGLLPDSCAVAFDVAWKSDAIALKVILFSDEVESASPGSGYEFSFQRGSVYLRNATTQAFLGSTHARALLESDRVRVELRASRASGKSCLLINGRVTEVWTDTEVARGKFGSCLHFVSQNTLPLRVSNITVAPWDGVVDEAPDPRGGMMRRFGIEEPDEDGEELESPPEGEPAAEGGGMELANGDRMQGEVTAIRDGLVAVKTPLGEIQLPVARLRTITLRQVEPERSIRRNGDIRASFADGSSMVFRLDAVGEGTLRGSSQNFGSADFKLAAFHRIEFNIYDVELEDKRAIDDW